MSKWLRRGALALLGVVAVLVGGGLLLPGSFQVSRSRLVQAPPDKVWPLVASPRQWPAWSVWNRRDPAMTITYGGPDSGVGASWAWVSASQGDGQMRFTAAEPNQRLGYALYFPDFGTTSTGELRLQAEGSGTRVTWTMAGDMGRNPLFHWIALNADRMVGADFDAGLANLQVLAEQAK